MLKRHLVSAAPKLLGGALCLDFGNTVDGRGLADARDLLDTYDDLLVWCERAGAINSELHLELQKEARKHSATAKRTLKFAVALREAVYRVFSQIARNRRPFNRDLDTFNTLGFEVLTRSQLKIIEDRVCEGWGGDSKALQQVLWPIARSARSLLTSPKVKWVRECANADCRWLFMDQSRNHSRRWCDMQSCGNLMKARRHYRRKRQLA